MSQMKCMKQPAVIYSIVGIVSVFLMMWFIVAEVGAHAPKTVSLSYDLQAKVLTVSVTHTRFSAGHYIDKIEIKKNGTLVASHSYKEQVSETFTHTYALDAVRGDVIEVKATCNKFGSASEKIRVD